MKIKTQSTILISHFLCLIIFIVLSFYYLLFTFIFTFSIFILQNIYENFKYSLIINNFTTSSVNNNYNFNHKNGFP